MPVGIIGMQAGRGCSTTAGGGGITKLQNSLAVSNFTIPDAQDNYPALHRTLKENGGRKAGRL